MQLIAPKVKRIVLVARNETRLRKFHESVAATLPCESEYTTDISSAVRPRAADPDRDDARRKTSSSPRICRPAPSSASSRCRTTSAGASRASGPTCSSSKAATWSCPGNPRFERVREPGTEFDLNLPPRTALACMSETMILALEGRFEPYTLGRGIQLEKVIEIRSDGRALRLYARGHARLRCGDHARENRRHRERQPAARQRE